VTNKITLYDLFKEDVSTLVNKISHPIEVEKEDVKSLLKNYFVGNSDAIYPQQVVHIGNHFLKVQKVVKASNRIFFEVRRGHLSLSSPEEISKEKLALKRAEFLQSTLKPIIFNNDFSFIR